MPQTIQSLMECYVKEIQKIYGSHLKQIILYGSYASDYDDFYIAVKSEVEELIDTATELIKYIEEYFENRQI